MTRAKNKNGMKVMRFLLISLIRTAISSTTTMTVMNGIRTNMNIVVLHPSVNGSEPRAPAMKPAGRNCEFSPISDASKS